MNEMVLKIQQSQKPLRILNSLNDIEIKELFKEYFWVITKQELIFCIKHEMSSQPICGVSICDNKIMFSEKNRKYNTGCCKSHTQMVNNRIKNGSESLKMTQSSIDKRKNTFLDRYGVDNPMKCEEFKKAQQMSVFESLGVKTPILNKEIQDKIKNTNIDRYGVDNPMKNSEVKKLLQETNLERFGVECCFMNEEIQLKKQQTCDDRYGVKFPLQSNFFLDKVKQTKIEKYGVEFPFQSTEIQQKIAKTNAENGKSKKEKCITSILPCSFQTSNRTILDGKELDVYIPNKKIAIEFNGIYWHSELNGKDKNYHLNKTISCNKKDIQLIHVFENEYERKPKIINSIILAKLGFFNKRIFARKCQIKEIPAKEKNQFLDENHLQGQDKSSIKMGLFYDDELVSVMTFGRSRYNKKYQWEMHRFCNKLNYQIVGGASKLWTYFVRNYSPESVITYADRRYSDGTFYEKIGFNKIGESKPNYFYFKGNSDLMSRLQFQKHKLKDKLDDFNPELTEWENMQINGYNRIWDCGNFVYAFEIKNV